MKTKITLLALPFLLYGIGYLLLNLYDLSGFCLGGETGTFNNENVCWSDSNYFGWPLKIFGMYLLPVSLLLFFSSKKIIKIWWTRFAIWFIPLGVVLFLVVDTYPHEFTYILPGSSWVATQLSSIFFITSALIIFFGNRKKNS